ncbi:MAG TPA: plastocyanin/azurin family copper-binding protein [Solirubrobacterales bacterium]|nr:plastocyanin/azurin family copper-binding protein [Solirubrobacterales bacterium]
MKKFAALFALLLAALALVACGGGSDTTGSETAAAPETTQEAEGEKEAEGGTAGSTPFVDIEAEPNGQLLFLPSEETAKAGKTTINFINSSPVPHDIAFEDSSGETIAKTEVISEGTDSTTAELKPGKYTYYCTIPGHRQAGMEGTLTVK